jgi:hypothetical protein
VCALGHYLEAEGLATTLIGLVRLHCEVMRPPRALWVPYELGRPLGPPNDPATQRTILMTALQLLVAEGGPSLITDLDRELPPEVEWHSQFKTEPVAQWPDDPIAASEFLRAEFRRAIPQYQRGRARLGHTTVGLASLAEEAIGDHIAAGYIAVATNKDLPASPIRGLHRMQALRFAIDDLKACYMEAAVAGGGQPSSRQLNNWFWRQTVAGQALFALREGCIRCRDNVVRKIGEDNLIPEAYL